MVVEVESRAQKLSTDFILKDFDALVMENGKMRDSSDIKTFFDTPKVEIQGRKWWLSINSDGYDDECTGFLSCFLSCDQMVTGKFSITLLHSSDPNMNVGMTTEIAQSIIDGLGRCKFVKSDHFATHFSANGSTVTFRVDIIVSAVELGQASLRQREL